MPHSKSFFTEQNRVFKERCSNMDKQLKTSQEDNERVRMERDGLRARILELQANLEEKEGEVRGDAEDRRVWGHKYDE